MHLSVIYNIYTITICKYFRVGINNTFTKWGKYCARERSEMPSAIGVSIRYLMDIE